MALSAGWISSNSSNSGVVDAGPEIWTHQLISYRYKQQHYGTKHKTKLKFTGSLFCDLPPRAVGMVGNTLEMETRLTWATAERVSWRNSYKKTELHCTKNVNEVVE